MIKVNRVVIPLALLGAFIISALLSGSITWNLVFFLIVYLIYSWSIKIPKTNNGMEKIDDEENEMVPKYAKFLEFLIGFFGRLIIVSLFWFITYWWMMLRNEASTSGGSSLPYLICIFGPAMLFISWIVATALRNKGKKYIANGILASIILGPVIVYVMDGFVRSVFDKF